MNIGVGERIRAESGVRYRIIDWLGRGGNSIVYLVQAEEGSNFGVLFALKVFQQIADQKRLEKFHMETDFLSKCDHPVIMRLFDRGVHTAKVKGIEGKYPFVIVEYLPMTLDKVIRQDGATTAEKVTFVVQLISALNYIHTKDVPVIHRDIKPANIFLKGKSCVLGDFGLMKFLIASEANEEKVYDIQNATIGMPKFYRTPDLINYINGTADLTTATDIYQFGLVVAHLFTNRNPQKKSDNILGPIVLEHIGYVPGTAFGAQIKASIMSMLSDDPITRPSAFLLFDEWDGIFRSVVQLSHELNGKVF